MKNEGMRAMKLDAVFEGGGVRGIGLVGALKVVEDNDYQIEHVAGASAGAIIAALVAARYTADEIRSIIFDIDFSRLTDLSGVGALPGLGKLINVLTKLGIYEGDYFLRLIRELLKQRGVTTFGDLRMDEFEGDLRYRYKLRVVTSDVSRGIKVVLPQEIKAYGVDPDDLEVALAVRMSMSIPFFFRPVRQAIGGQRTYVVDGGLLSNFPVDLFDSDGMPEWPTFGFRLVAGAEPAVIPHSIRGPISMLRALFSTAMESNDARYIATHNFVRSIVIDTKGVPSTRFDLTEDQKNLLYTSGVDAARNFLALWDWEAYKTLFRSGSEPPSRRQLILGGNGP